MRRLTASTVILTLSCGVGAAAQLSRPVPAAPPAKAAVQPFHDRHFGVRFEVPAGWLVNRKDGQVSTFRLDARSAEAGTQMRGVASIAFNPYPLSTFSGALFYYSVQKHTNDRECEEQASKFSRTEDTLNIGGMDFTHGHDQHGDMCIEGRDEVYTAYRKGSCYRFDLEVNTFCADSSGALEMTRRQYDTIERQMEGILQSVKLDWKPERETAPAKDDHRRSIVPEPRGVPMPAMQSFR